MQANRTQRAARDAVQARDKTLAAKHLNALDPVLGKGYPPARHSLRAAQCAVDIGRWDLATSRLDEVAALLNAHSPVEG